MKVSKNAIVRHDTVQVLDILRFMHKEYKDARLIPTKFDHMWQILFSIEGFNRVLTIFDRDFPSDHGDLATGPAISLFMGFQDSSQVLLPILEKFSGYYRPFEVSKKIESNGVVWTFVPAKKEIKKC